MPTNIAVLDHGFVRLVSYMQPVPVSLKGVSSDEHIDEFVTGRPADSWTGDLEVVRNARVSYDADWRTGDDDGKDEKLLGYMYHNQHTSPFEAMVFTFEIKCPLFIARQWHRHRTWSYNEVSARYAELPDDYYVPEVWAIGSQDEKNKQARNIANPGDSDINVVFHGESKDLIYESSKASHEDYQVLLARGVPREIARSVLPVNTYTRYFGTVNLHNLIRFCLLRSDSHAQWEIQQYSNALIKLVKPICPVAVGHLIDELHARSLDE